MGCLPEGGGMGCYISPAGSSVLLASACHPDLFLKQSLTLNPRDVCFSSVLSCSPSAYVCPTACPTCLPCFSLRDKMIFWAECACLDSNSVMWLSIPEPIHDWGLWGSGCVTTVRSFQALPLIPFTKIISKFHYDHCRCPWRSPVSW